MNYIDAIKERKSVRTFNKNKDVEPSLLDIGSEVVISFSLYNGVLYPHLRRLTGLFSVKVGNMHIVDDYRAKYRAKVKKKIGDFRYLVEIIDIIS